MLRTGAVFPDKQVRGRQGDEGRAQPSFFPGPWELLAAVAVGVLAHPAV